MTGLWPEKKEIRELRAVKQLFKNDKQLSSRGFLVLIELNLIRYNFYPSICRSFSRCLGHFCINISLVVPRLL